jgi:caa(3)-type oxidase subunit IV
VITSKAVGVRAYIVTAVALLALTGLTIGLAFVPLGPWQVAVALGIAATKALLIAVVFMHLRSGTATTRLTAIAGLFWLAILLAGTLDDVVTRGWLAVPGT